MRPLATTSARFGALLALGVSIASIGATPPAPRLRPGETLLWSGQPKQGLHLRVHDVGLIPFSIMWCGFAVVWTYNVFHSNAPIFMKIWGVPFVLIGLYLLVGRFFVDAHVRQRISYGLTDQRVIVLGGLWRSRMASHSLSKLDRIELAEHRDGTGTVYLDGKKISLHSMDWSRDNVWTGWSLNRLERINDAQWVYNKVLELQSTKT